MKRRGSTRTARHRNPHRRVCRQLVNWLLMMVYSDNLFTCGGSDFIVTSLVCRNLPSPVGLRSRWWRSIQPTRVRARANLPGSGIKAQIIPPAARFGLERFPWIQPGVCVFSQPAFSLLHLVLLLCHSVSCCKQRGVRSRKSWY